MKWHATLMKWHATLKIVALSLIVDSIVYPADPDALLSQADHLANVGNSVKARPLYAEAEKEFHARGDAKRELYAKFGRLHRDVESGSYSAVSEELAGDLANPNAQNDPALKNRALSVKGIIDLNLNTPAALDDFTQIQILARTIGDRKWENRAAGELGIIATERRRRSGSGRTAEGDQHSSSAEGRRWADCIHAMARKWHDGARNG